jgi:hypothetical protein
MFGPSLRLIDHEGSSPQRGEKSASASSRIMSILAG